MHTTVCRTLDLVMIVLAEQKLSKADAANSDVICTVGVAWRRCVVMLDRFVRLQHGF